MKVHELVARLQECNQELPVVLCFQDASFGEVESSELEVVLLPEKEEKYYIYNMRLNKKTEYIKKIPKRIAIQ